MSSFVFSQSADQIITGTLDLSVDQYYAHLVESEPDKAITMVSQLVLCSANGYASQTLAGVSLVNNVWSFNVINFPTYITSVPLTGVVICKQLGGNPASTDPAVCYSSFHNGSGAVVTIAPGTIKISHNFGINGAIKLLNVYGYSSGTYSGTFPDSNGMIYLLGTSNGTASYSNPLDGGTLSKLGNLNFPTLIFDRDTTVGAGFNGTGLLDLFGSSGDNRRKIKIGSINLWASTYNGGAVSTVTLWGSNILPSFTINDGNNNAYWTQLGSVAVEDGNRPLTSQRYIIISSDTTSYWRYIKLTTTLNLNLQEIEFYSSVIASPDVNMAM